MSGRRNEERRRYRHRVDTLLEQLDDVRRRQNLLQAAGFRGRAVGKLEQKREHLRRELAATVATRATGTDAAVGSI